MILSVFFSLSGVIFKNLWAILKNVLFDIFIIGIYFDFFKKCVY